VESHTVSRRGDDLLNAYATDLARAEWRIADLEGERDIYRELAVVALDAVRQLTVTNQDLTTENQRLRDENRSLYDELHIRCDGDVWAA
jgi:hypothetical protein